jgi:hypothetical protein
MMSCTTWRTRVATCLEIAIAVSALAALSCAPTGASYTVRIVNHDSLALDSVVISGPGVQWAFGSVPPGRDAERTFVVRQDALLHLSALRGQRPARVVLGGYPGRGPGGHVEVLVTMGGDLNVGTPVPWTGSPRRP